MSRTRLLLAAALVTTCVAAPAALAAPACSNPVAVAAHEVEEAAEPTPVGALTTPVVHGVVEPVACALP